ncbi:unnamed protein product [Dibothriocephalus latus]|uniref:Uncharacterized protein n=1 Tax=Dibothriocephalus latus TaxID=60516 RepID=A0A3P7LR65_DIBLA|nr:unnamed protein product [Dibothriocephalus latus]
MSLTEGVETSAERDSGMATAIESPPPRSPIVLTLSCISIALVFIAVHACTLTYIQNVGASVKTSLYGLIGTSLAVNILFVIIALVAAVYRHNVYFFFVSNVLFFLMCKLFPCFNLYPKNAFVFTLTFH